MEKKASLKVEIDMETGRTLIDGPFQDEVLYVGLLGLAFLSLIETRAQKGKQAELKADLPKIERPIVLPPWAIPKKQ